jgi:hypothetical protein
MIKGAVVQNVSWEKRKARLLIQILALQPMRKLHCEELIEKLFPDVDGSFSGNKVNVSTRFGNTKNA